MESVQCDLALIFIALPEKANNFAKIRLVFKIWNVASFIKIRSYWKRDSIKMRKNAETSYANKDFKLANVVFIPTSPFSKQEFVEHFPNVICTKTRPLTLLLFIWKSTTLTLSFIWFERNGNTFLVFARTFKIERITIFLFSFCIGHVTQLNGSALGVLKHHYITKRIHELLIGNSSFLIYNLLNHLLYAIK